jgi:methyl-accepting chemotaxis protein
MPSMPVPKADMTRRKTDPSRARTMAATRTAMKGAAAAQAAAAKAGKRGARLKTEIVLPVGVGAMVMCAALGLVAAGSAKVGAPLPLTLTVGGLILVAGLVVYVTWVVDSAVAKPLAKVRDALQEVEGGNYDMRLASDGASELCEVQQGFNRMATIVGHQRERLKVAAATDGLTGLANHRHFQERLRAEVQ